MHTSTMSGNKGSVSTKDLTDEGEDGLSDTAEETMCQLITSCRWTLSYVGCICFTLIYALRTNMGIAVVCMVKPTALPIENQSIPEECLATYTNTSVQQATGGDIAWDKTTQGWVLSSFFYGYIVTQIPGGYLSGRFGGKIVMFVGLLVYSLVTIVTPFAARFDGKDYNTSAGLVIALRVIAGLATGVVFPAMQNLLGRWSPPYERSKLAVLCFSGTMVGNVLMLGLGGFFCEWTSFDGGWPSMFYVGGGVCFLFCFVWWFMVYDSPADHPRISEREKLFIQRSLEGKQAGKNVYVPWIQIITSPAMWAIIVAHCCNNFGNYTLLTKLPAIMQEVLHFDIKSNGLYSTLPYIAMFIIANTVSNIIDKLREKQIVRTTTARKLAMNIAFIIPAAILVATGHVPCNMNYLGVIFLTIAVGFTGFNRSGYNTNPQDLAPRYAGEIFGISNTFATIPGMIASNIVNALTPNGTTKEWQTVFYVWAGIFGFGAIFYSIFARGEIQPWANPEKNENMEMGKENMTVSDEDLTEKKSDTRL